MMGKTKMIMNDKGFWLKTFDPKKFREDAKFGSKKRYLGKQIKNS